MFPESVWISELAMMLIPRLVSAVFAPVPPLAASVMLPVPVDLMVAPSTLMPS
jgi:hypothetical protein